MKEKFIHFRAYDSRRSNTSKGGVTALIEYDGIKKARYVSLAICNASDTYHKRIGRDYCRERMENGYYITIHNVDEAYLYNRVLYLAEAISGQSLA